MTTPVPATFTVAQAMDWIQRFGAAIHEQNEYLTQLDAAIGDGDHGINMDRGCTAVLQKLDAAPPDDLGALCKLVGTTLISTVGGASGPLYGTAFLRMGVALAGKAAVDTEGLGAALHAAYEGVAARGKSTRGEKTMLDAFGPALDAFEAARGTGSALQDVLVAATAGAGAGAQATIPLQATKGRASYLGEGSAGHQDPGATSTWLLFRALAESV
ncbi:MAG TPA: dihydroxyacetone kinase subunit DhaL [Chloroflexota bacterium]|nr:dihydroxyacetone kinase subunit DhaL [Chloroflexota bacterium]